MKNRENQIVFLVLKFMRDNATIGWDGVVEKCQERSGRLDEVGFRIASEVSDALMTTHCYRRPACSDDLPLSRDGNLSKLVLS